MQPAKRRKLDQPHPFLNRPFRSPLRSVPNLLAQPSQDKSQKSTDFSTTGTHLSPSQDGRASHNINQRSPALNSTIHLEVANEELGDLQKQQTALAIRLTQLRQCLENADQALEIEASGQGSELARLITRWRTIAQDAAEELFVDAKARVDRNGGMAAWRRRAEEDSQRWRDDDEEQNQVQKEVYNPAEILYQNDLSVANAPERSEPEEGDEEKVSQGWLLIFPVCTNFAFFAVFHHGDDATTTEY